MIVGSSSARIMSATCSNPCARNPLKLKPSVSPVATRSSAVSSSPTTIVFTPVRHMCAAAWRPRIVLPVPLRPTTSVDRPAGRPPAVSTSKPGTPVRIFLRMVIERFYSTRNKKVDERSRVRQIAKDVGAWQRLFLEQHGCEADAVGFRALRVAAHITYFEVHSARVEAGEQGFTIARGRRRIRRRGADVQHELDRY